MFIVLSSQFPNTVELILLGEGLVKEKSITKTLGSVTIHLGPDDPYADIQQWASAAIACGLIIGYDRSYNRKEEKKSE